MSEELTPEIEEALQQQAFRYLETDKYKPGRKELANTPQWFLWDNKEGRKIPLNRWGDHSGVDRDTDYLSFDEAAKIYHYEKPRGIAFVFTKSDPFFGIDLDDAINEDRTLKDWAREIVEEANSYTEISPSGTGVKIFCKGSIADGTRCRWDVGDGMVEIYSHGRFFAYTEVAFGDYDEVRDFDPTALIDRITPEEPVMEMRTISMAGTSYALVERARAYMLSASRPSKGGRNSAAFSLAGHLLAFNDDGEYIAESDVLELMRDWNDSLPEPLADHEIRTCVRNAATKGTPRQGKDSGVMAVDVEAMNAASMIMQSFDLPESNVPNPIETEEPSECKRRIELPPVPGLVGDLWEYMWKTAIYPQRELALGAAIATVAALVSRKVVSDMGDTPNIYIVGIAPTGSGKEYARKAQRELLTAVCHPERRLLGPSDIVSAAGMYGWLEGNGYASVFPLDEIGHLFEAVVKGAKQSGHLIKISKGLLELYSSAEHRQFTPASYGDSKKNITLINPHLSIYGTTTPVRFWSSLTEETLTDGLLARFMIFEGSRNTPQKDWEPTPMPQSIASAATVWANYDETDLMGITDPVVAKTRPDARRRLEEHRDNIAAGMFSDNEIDAAIWARVNERARKIALIIAAGRVSPKDPVEITLRDVNIGIKLSNHCARYLISKSGLVGGGDNQRVKDLRKMETVIRENPGITQSVLGRKLQQWPARVRNEMLADLAETGRIAIEKIDDGQGRTVTRFRTI